MITALFTHLACLEHNMHPGHSEQPDRLRTILAQLQRDEFQDLARFEAPLATVDQIALVHPRSHVETVLSQMPEVGHHQFDPDTGASPGTKNAVLRAAGSVPAAIDKVMSGDIQNAFCGVRPPGHHAEPERVMGFCFFNNVAVGALHARSKHGLGRIAVIDFDVHYGNGTQAMFWHDPELFYGSTHQAPFYPGTGWPEERGQGNIVNVPLAANSGSKEFRAAITDQILPALESFNPEFLLISAGFDAHEQDPLAQLRLTEADFSWVTDVLCDVAQTKCKGRVVSVLEGGYNLKALAASVAVHVGSLMRA